MRREDFSSAVQAALAQADRWGIEQHGDEIGQLATLVQELRPRRSVEIGFRRGGTLALWATLTPPDGTVLGIDLPDDFTMAQASKLMEAYSNLQIWLCDSHKQSLPMDLGAFFDHQPLDFLFIDGDHSADGVRRDWNTFGPLVRRGGLIAFHDIQPHPETLGVHALWKELRSSHLDTEEFNIGAEWGGIGVVRV